MLAIGCLVPFVTLALGAAVGSFAGGIHGGYWGAGIGAAIGLVLAAVGFFFLDRLRGRSV